ncbi:MAG: class I SAM-dependent methyltransferase [Rhodoferax sp.]
MICPLCSGRMKHCFNAQVLGKYSARFEVCDECGFLRVPEPHWLEEAYSSAIASSDTGLVMRNISLACKLAGVLYWVLNERGQGTYLDVAGGYGMLTRIMRDFGFNFYWSDKYCQNLLAPGFEFDQESGPCRAVTALEVFEHLTDPKGYVEEVLSYSGSEYLFFTTELYRIRPPQPNEWPYYSLKTGQHIGFFQIKTLETLAAGLGLKFFSANGVHVLSKREINKGLMQLVTRRWISAFMPILTRRYLGSKTISDNQLVLSRF